MIHPAPTSKIDPTLARGVLESVSERTKTDPGHIVVSFPNTSYETHLRPTAEITAEIGKRIIGTIRVEARRLDVVDTGGKYIEPVYGQPRRIQGRVIAIVPETNSVVADCGMPVHLHLTDARQKASDFAQGDLVTCDVRDGATFTPAK